MPRRDPLYTTAAWRQLRKRILDRDGFDCQIRLPGVCTGTATQADHIIPRVEAPDLAMVPDNLRAACAACNGHLGGKLGALRDGPRRRMRRLVSRDGYGAW